MTAGEHIGPYLIQARLGEGGMGEVYRAWDTRLDRTVALKVSKAEFGERFKNEARAIAALNHPNICTLFDVGPSYLVMEHIEGTPLRGPLPVEKAVEYASQILDALDAAHRKGFTHRDLKPANILVTKQGIKLLDFGLAKQKAPLKESDATLTQEGQIVGTLQYMSPEQLQGKEADARSDLFAFGCVLYEMLSGKRAYEGASAASVIAAILEREPAPLGLHPPLGRVIAKCLAKDPDDRFQSARDLKYNLSLAMEQQPAAVAKANRWPWVAVAAALVAGAFGGGWAVSRSGKTSSDEQAVRLQLAPPEGGRFEPGSLAVSQDGRMLAYAATVQGKLGLWVRGIDSASARLLPGTDGARQPFWSPDARSVGYFANRRWWRIALAGGDPISIQDADADPRGGAWGPDGTIVTSIFPNPLSRVSASGGPPTPLTTLNASRGETYHSWPQILPGGRVILFFVVARPEHTGVYAARVDRPGEHIRLIASDSSAVYSAGHLFWRHGSALVAQRFDVDRLQLTGDPRPVTDPVGNGTSPRQIALAASNDGVLLYGSWSPAVQLTWIDRSGRPAGTVGAPGTYSGFALSKDGRRVAVSKRRGDSGSDLWTVDIGRDAWSRLTFGTAYSDSPIWSTDGRTLLFQSGNPNNLFRVDAGGGFPPVRIVESGNSLISRDWSLDGQTMMYDELSPGTNRDIWVLSVTPDGKPKTGARPQPYLRTPFNEMGGQFSPEPSPSWVAYESDESGTYEVYVQAYPEPKGKFLISSGGGRGPRWGPGGRELFYVSGGKLTAVKLKMDAESVTASSPVALFGVAWGNVYSSPFAVSPDGQRFLVQIPVETAARPLEVIVNWPALLKKAGSTE